MRRWWLLAMLGFISACSLRGERSEPLEFSYHTTTRVRDQHRILVIPPWRSSSVGPSAQSIDQALQVAVSELGIFAAEPISSEQRDQWLPDAGSGMQGVTPERLRTLRDHTGADAVLLGRIQFWQSYDPIAVGLELHLVSCHDGSTLWSVSAHLDGARADVQRDIQRWHKDVVGRGQAQVGGWQLTLQTPSLFSRYACERVCATLLEQPL